MSLPVLKLGSPIPTTIESQSRKNAHEKVVNALEYHMPLAEGDLLMVVWKGVVHEVIYQTPLEDEVAQESRNSLLFEAYGEGLEWTEVLDNGFGKTYRRTDQQRFALWSYAMDFNTFGTMDYHEVMWS